jgi:hypothetical protein
MSDKNLEIKFSVTIDNASASNVEKVIRRTDDSLEKLEKQYEKTGASAERSARKAESAFSTMGNNIKASITTALGGITLGAIYSFGKASVEAYDASTRAQLELERALGKTSTLLISQASALQKVTRFEDDATVAAMARVAVYVKDEQALSRLMPLIQDFATAKSMDLASASELVGKSIGGEVNALGRYGISLGEASTKTEKLTALTKQLQDKFGGASAIAGGTGTAGLIQFKNAVGDLQEVIGQKLLPYLDFWTEKLSGLASEWQSFLNETENQNNATNEQIENFKKLTVVEEKLKVLSIQKTRQMYLLNKAGKWDKELIEGRIANIDSETKSLEQQKVALDTQSRGLVKLSKKKMEDAEASEKKRKQDELDAENAERRAKNADKWKKQEEERVKAVADANKRISDLQIDGIEDQFARMRAKAVQEAEAMRKALIDARVAPEQASGLSNSFLNQSLSNISVDESADIDKKSEERKKKREQEEKKRQDEAKKAEEERAKAEKLASEVSTRMGSEESVQLANLKNRYDEEYKMLEDHKLSTLELESWYTSQIDSIHEQSARKETDAKLNAYQKMNQGLLAMAQSFELKNKQARVALKGALIAEAIANSAVAITRLYRDLPIYLAIPASIGLTAGLAAQVNNIRQQKFASGGIVAGSSYSGDRVNARLNSGEMVLNGTQQRNMFNQINSQQPARSTRTSNITIESIIVQGGGGSSSSFKGDFKDSVRTALWELQEEGVL